MAKRHSSENSYAVPKKSVSQKSWFEGMIVLSSLGLAWLLWQGFLYAPVTSFEPSQQWIEQAQSLEYAAHHGQIMDMLPSIQMAPLYSLLLAGWLEITQALSPLFNDYGLPLGTNPRDFQLFLFVISVILVHYVTRRQLNRPFNYIVSALYALAPMTILKGDDVGPVMANIVFTLIAWLFTDIAFNPAPAKASSDEISPSMPKRLMVNKKCLLGATFAIAAAALCHPAGYILLLAFGFVLLRKNASDSILKSLLVFLSILLPFGISYVYQQTDGFSHWSVDAVNPFIHMTLPTLSLIELHSREFLSTLTHLTTSSVTLFGFDPANMPVFQWFIASLMLTGLFFGFKQKTGFAATYLILYTLVFYILSEAEPTISPALPLLLMFLYHGLSKIGELMKAMYIPFTPVMAPVLTAFILLGMFGAYWQDVNQVSSPQTHSAAKQVAIENRLNTTTNNTKTNPTVIASVPKKQPYGKQPLAANQIYTPSPIDTHLVNGNKPNLKEKIKARIKPQISRGEPLDLTAQHVGIKATIPESQALSMAAVAEPAKATATSKKQVTTTSSSIAKDTDRTVHWIASNLPSSAKIAIPQNYDIKPETSPAATIGSKLPVSQISNIYVNEETPDMLINRLMNSEYVLEDWENPTSNQNLSKTLSLYNRHFRLIYNDTRAKVRLWQIL